MSDPSDSIRRQPRPSRKSGTAAAGVIGVLLFLAPFALALAAFPNDRNWLPWVEIVLAMAAVAVLNAAFVAAETAIQTLRASHAKQLAADEAKAAIVRDLVEGKAHYVAAAYLGSQTMRFWLALLVFPIAATLAPSIAEQFGTSLVSSTLIAAFLVAIPVAAVNILLAELVPRSYASTNPVKASLRLAGFVRFFATAFYPAIAAATSIGNLLSKRFGGLTTFALSNQAEEEIKERLEQAVETQEIEEGEKEMLHSVFEFGDTVAREVMTPRVDLDAVPVTSTLEEVAKIVEESGHSRIPVYEGTDDQILGIVHAKDVLSAISRGQNGLSLRRIMRPALFVPENKNLMDLLHEMRQKRTQMVIVQDEFGGTAGVVTIEDIVEEVVGEIVDEYDEEETLIVKNGSGFLIGGRLNLYDVNDEIGTELSSDEFDTIGGFVFGLFGRQPNQGETVDFEGYRFTVAETDGRRILSVRLEPVTPEEPAVAPVEA
jgi:putative hemolysin